MITKRNAYLLIEALIAIVIIGIFCTIAIPMIENHKKEQELIHSSSTIMQSINLAKMDAKSEEYEENGSSRSSRVTFHVEKEKDGRVYWFTTKGGKINRGKEYLSNEITSEGEIHLTFDKDMITPMGRSYEMLLKTKDNRHKVKLTVALYTGRVKMEKVS